MGEKPMGNDEESARIASTVPAGAIGALKGQGPALAAAPRQGGDFPLGGPSAIAIKEQGIKRAADAAAAAPGGAAHPGASEATEGGQPIPGVDIIVKKQGH